MAGDRNGSTGPARCAGGPGFHRGVRRREGHRELEQQLPARLESRTPSSQRGATTHHSFRGSFSAASTPILTTKYSFFSIFQDLQHLHNSAPLESQNFAKFCKIFVILKKIQLLTKLNILQILKFQVKKKSDFRAVQKCADLVDLEKCCKITVWLQQSVLIQPRTSLEKSDVSSAAEKAQLPTSGIPAPAQAAAWDNGKTHGTKQFWTL